MKIALKEVPAESGTKFATLSQVDIIQGILAILAVLASPQIAGLIPLEWMPAIVLGANALNYILCSFFKCQPVKWEPGK